MKHIIKAKWDYHSSYFQPTRVKYQWQHLAVFGRQMSLVHLICCLNLLIILAAEVIIRLKFQKKIIKLPLLQGMKYSEKTITGQQGQTTILIRLFQTIKKKEHTKIYLPSLKLILTTVYSFQPELMLTLPGSTISIISNKMGTDLGNALINL